MYRNKLPFGDFVDIVFTQFKFDIRFPFHALVKQLDRAAAVGSLAICAHVMDSVSVTVLSVLIVWTVCPSQCCLCS